MVTYLVKLTQFYRIKIDSMLDIMGNKYNTLLRADRSYLLIQLTVCIGLDMPRKSYTSSNTQAR